MRTTSPRVKRYGHSETSKYVVEGLRIAGKRVRKFFRSEREAKAWLRQYEARAAAEGTAAPLLIPDALRVEAVSLAERLRPYGATLTMAVEHYVTHRAAVERSCTVDQLIAEFRKANEDDGLTVRTLADRKSRLGMFASDFGGRITATVQGYEINDWLRGRGTSQRDRNNHRAVLLALFNFAVLMKYAPANPVAETKKVEPPEADVQTLSPTQMRAVLDKVSADHLPVFLIGGFAGLRTSEIERLDWSDVNLAQGHIFVNKDSKTGRRYVTISENLAKWIAPIAQESGRVATGMDTKAARKAACEAAGLAEWPDNALRHSFGSYHLAHHRNDALTAHQMGNSVPMVRKHYDKVATPQEAADWWAILPPADYANVIAFKREAASA